MLNVIIKQSFNILFILLRKPVIWIMIMGLLGMLVFLVTILFKWDASIMSAAMITALILNIPPGNVSVKMDETAYKDLIDDTYETMGITGGLIKHRLGLVLFCVTGIASYTLLFGEFCSPNNSCIPLYRTLF